MLLRDVAYHPAKKTPHFIRLGVPSSRALRCSSIMKDAPTVAPSEYPRIPSNGLQKVNMSFGVDLSRLGRNNKVQNFVFQKLFVLHENMSQSRINMIRVFKMWTYPCSSSVRNNDSKQIFLDAATVSIVFCPFGRSSRRVSSADAASGKSRILT